MVFTVIVYVLAVPAFTALTVSAVGALAALLSLWDERHQDSPAARVEDAARTDRDVTTPIRTSNERDTNHEH